MRLSILLLLLCIGCLHAFSQTSMNAGNGEANSNSGSISYSIGQTFYVGETDRSGSVFPGVQQTYKIIPVGESALDLSLEVKVYPNPATDYFVLAFNNVDITGFSARLADSTGKVIRIIDIRDAVTKIEADSYPPGIYYLYVLNEQSINKVFKIIKK